MSADQPNDAWAAFIAELKEAFESGGEEKVQKRPIAVKQAQYTFANLAVARLLHNAGPRDMAEQFRKIAQALQDVVDVQPHPLFAVDGLPAKSGRRPDTTEVWHIRSNLCVGLRFLMAGGDMDQETAIH